MAIRAFFFRVDDPSVLLVAALVILVAGAIAYLNDLRTRRKPRDEQDHYRRAA